MRPTLSEGATLDDAILHSVLYQKCLYICPKKGLIGKILWSVYFSFYFHFLLHDERAGDTSSPEKSL